jgi:hypothetical protein
VTTTIDSGRLNAVLSFLSGKGLTKDQAAGVAGNLVVESGLDPKAHNDREGAIGIAQWEGPRRTAVQRFAASRGTKETDLNTQLAFLWSELQGPEHNALVALQQANSASAAATAFDLKYERSSGTARKQRIDAAQVAAKFPIGGDWSSNPVATAAGDAFASTANAVGDVASALNPLTLFQNWQNDLTGLALKVLAGTAAAALVIGGVWSAVHNDNGGSAA